MAMFTLYLIAFTPARKSYRTGLLFTHKTVISAILCHDPKWRVTYWIGVDTIHDSFSCRHEKLHCIRMVTGVIFSRFSGDVMGDGAEKSVKTLHAQAAELISKTSFATQ